jgi:hypothetical protein
VLASRHDTNTVYATFNNMLRGDFTPYALRSRDRGRTWTSIRGSLPDRDQVWTIAEDHVDPNILFVGTEHGASVTLDGGQTWRPLRAGLPPVAVRDIQIQRRENDLVLGTFGRGLYVMDDYSPLRALASQSTAEGMLISPRAARVFAETPFQRAGVGNGLYTGENPPFGALLSYTLREAAPSGSQIVLLIKDVAGKTIAEVNGPNGAGLNRAVWNLRRAPDTMQVAGRGTAGGRGAPADSAQGAEGRGRGNAPRIGPLVSPGTYTVQLARRSGLTVTNVGVARQLRVIPLER